MSEAAKSPRISALTVYVGIIVILAVILPVALLIVFPAGHYGPGRWFYLAVAGLVLHVLNQLNFTIRFSGQPDNVELTFTEAALVALFFSFDPGVVALLSGLAHFVREIQAHRRRRIQVVFNTAEIIVSVSLAGFVYKGLYTALGDTYIVAAIIAAMLTHSVANRLFVGTVISLNAGKFHSRYYKSLFVENVVMLFMNLALGMTIVMALLLDRPYLLWVPLCILGVVYVAYQAYVDQLRDSNTLARLYENALITSTSNEATLIPEALSKILDTFTSREVKLTMAAGPAELAEWRLEQDARKPVFTRKPGSVLQCEGAQGPSLLSTLEPTHARAWRHGARCNGMAAPVQFEDQLMGVLHAVKPRAWDAFTAGDLRAFALFARQLGVALENTRLSELDREQQRLRQRALDAERNRISRDLHDSFVQTLVHVDLGLAYLQRLLEKKPEKAAEEVDSLQRNVQAGMREARTYMAELKPLRIDPGEFTKVAQRYLDDFARMHNIQTSFEHDDRELTLNADDLTELFQIIREGLNNIAKHSQARHAVLAVSIGETHVTIRLRDDGVGFETSRISFSGSDGHFGLANICERANGLGAAVDWASNPGAGTTLTIMIPQRITSDVLRGTTP